MAPRNHNQRIAAFMLGLGVLNLLLTVVVCVLAIRSWGEIPLLPATLRVVAADGVEIARRTVPAPTSMGSIDAAGFAENLELADGSRAEWSVPRSYFERVAAGANTLKLLQITVTLAASLLLLVAGRRLRQTARDA